jgi:hypothetical protein
MTSPTDPRNDFDSPWKLALESYFSEFVHFFFPAIASDIDWQRGYEFLDTQLQQIIREAETGLRFIDWLLALPPALETLFWQDLIAFEQENRMPYMLSLERMAREQGREEGRERQVNLLLKLLQRKLGDIPVPLLSIIRGLDFDGLEALGEAVFDLESPSQVAESLIATVNSETGQEVVQLAVLLSLVSNCLGDLPESTQERLGQLSLQQARGLARSIWQWESEADLVAWLDSNSTI